MNHEESEVELIDVSSDEENENTANINNEGNYLLSLYDRITQLEIENEFERNRANEWEQRYHAEERAFDIRPEPTNSECHQYKQLEPIAEGIPYIGRHASPECSSVYGNSSRISNDEDNKMKPDKKAKEMPGAVEKPDTRIAAGVQVKLECPKPIGLTKPKSRLGLVCMLDHLTNWLGESGVHWASNLAFVFILLQHWVDTMLGSFIATFADRRPSLLLKDQIFGKKHLKKYASASAQSSLSLQKYKKRKQVGKNKKKTKANVWIGGFRTKRENKANDVTRRNDYELISPGKITPFGKLAHVLRSKQC
ncbi:hypothetical protein Ddc_13440 [Ditylenchus destructor]|nr:hypothetical protein Ddc_13440 [Ditylenchus destructor]